MKIVLTDSYDVQLSTALLGYVGETNARPVTVEGMEVDGADRYVLTIDYGDGVTYEVDITGGIWTPTADILRVARNVSCQISARKYDNGNYTLVKKSKIFSLRIGQALSDGVAPIPSPSVAADALDRMTALGDRITADVQTAVTAAETATTAAENAEKSATDAGVSADTAEQAASRAETAQTASETSATQAETAMQGADTARQQAVAAQNNAKISADIAAAAAQQTTADKTITAGYAQTAQTAADSTAIDRQAVQDMAEQVEENKTAVAENAAQVATDRKAAETAAQIALESAGSVNQLKEDLADCKQEKIITHSYQNTIDKTIRIDPQKLYTLTFRYNSFAGIVNGTSVAFINADNSKDFFRAYGDATGTVTGQEKTIYISKCQSLRIVLRGNEPNLTFTLVKSDDDYDNAIIDSDWKTIIDYTATESAEDYQKSITKIFPFKMHKGVTYRFRLKLLNYSTNIETSVIRTWFGLGYRVTETQSSVTIYRIRPENELKPIEVFENIEFTATETSDFLTLYFGMINVGARCIVQVLDKENAGYPVISDVNAEGNVIEVISGNNKLFKRMFKATPGNYQGLALKNKKLYMAITGGIKEFSKSGDLISSYINENELAHPINICDIPNSDYLMISSKKADEKRFIYVFDYDAQIFVKSAEMPLIEHYVSIATMPINSDFAYIVYATLNKDTAKIIKYNINNNIYEEIMDFDFPYTYGQGGGIIGNTLYLMGNNGGNDIYKNTIFVINAIAKKVMSEYLLLNFGECEGVAMEIEGEKLVSYTIDNYFGGIVYKIWM